MIKRKWLNCILLLLLMLLPAMSVQAGVVGWSDYGDDTATVFWQKPGASDLAGYRVIWTGPDGTNKSADIDTTTTLQYTVTDLMPNVTYSVRVQYKTVTLGFTEYHTLGDVEVQCRPGAIPVDQIQYEPKLYTEWHDFGCVTRDGPYVSYPYQGFNSGYLKRTIYEAEVRNHDGRLLWSGRLLSASSPKDVGQRGVFCPLLGWATQDPAVRRNVTLISFRYAYILYGHENETPRWSDWSTAKVCVPQPELIEGGGKSFYYCTKYNYHGYRSTARYKNKKGLGFRKDKNLHIAWLEVDGASRYEIYVAEYSDKTRKAKGWKKVKTAYPGINKIQTATIKKYKGKAFKQKKHYVFKIVTYAGRGMKSQNILYSNCYYVWYKDSGRIKWEAQYIGGSKKQ